MTSILFGFTQDLILVLEVFPILCGLNTNVFHLGNFFENPIDIAYGIWSDPFPFQNPLLP